MKTVHKIISCLILISLLLSSTATSYAAPAMQSLKEKDNEKDVKLEIEKGWKDVALGDVVWGDRIGYNDYYDFSLAVVNTIRDRDFAPLEDFFGDQIDSMMDKMSESVQEFGEAALRDLLLRAFMGKGETVKEGRLEISAGFATVDYWYEVSWKEPRTYKCKWKEKYTGWWTTGVCTTAVTKEDRVYILPKFKPFIRYRASGLPTLPTSAILQRVEALLQGEELSVDETSRLITNQILGVMEETVPQIPSSSIEPTVLQSVERAVERYGTTDIEQIINQAAAEVDEAIASYVSTYSGSLTFDFAESNRPKVRSAIKEQGWKVVWGVNMDEIEYQKFLTAVAGSFVSGGATLAIYFTEYFSRTVEKIQRQAPGIARDLLMDVIAQAMKDPGQVFQIENLQVKAGIATYDRWLEFQYPEFTADQCNWVDIPKVGKIEGWCLEVGLSDFEFNLPNHHQPYIKFRFDNGSIPEPEGKPQEEDRVYRSIDYVRCNQRSEVFVDDDAEQGGIGTQERPVASILAALTCVEDGGTIWLMPGSYNERLVLSRPVIIQSIDGDATIGR